MVNMSIRSRCQGRTSPVNTLARRHPGAPGFLREASEHARAQMALAGAGPHVSCERCRPEPLIPMMPTTLEVLFAPAEFARLDQRDLRHTVCVVFDVLRATSTMVTALGNGAAAIAPVAEIAEALAFRQRQPDVLLAGERDGVRIAGAPDRGHRIRPGQFAARVHRRKSAWPDRRHDHHQRDTGAARVRAGGGGAAGLVPESACYGGAHCQATPP